MGTLNMTATEILIKIDQIFKEQNPERQIEELKNFAKICPKILQEKNFLEHLITKLNGYEICLKSFPELKNNNFLNQIYKQHIKKTTVETLTTDNKAEKNSIKNPSGSRFFCKQDEKHQQHEKTKEIIKEDKIMNNQKTVDIQQSEDNEIYDTVEEKKENEQETVIEEVNPENNQKIKKIENIDKNNSNINNEPTPEETKEEKKEDIKFSESSNETNKKIQIQTTEFELISKELKKINQTLSSINTEIDEKYIHMLENVLTECKSTCTYTEETKKFLEELLSLTKIEIDNRTRSIENVMKEKFDFSASKMKVLYQDKEKEYFKLQENIQKELLESVRSASKKLNEAIEDHAKKPALNLENLIIELKNKEKNIKYILSCVGISTIFSFMSLIVIMLK